MTNPVDTDLLQCLVIEIRKMIPLNSIFLEGVSMLTEVQRNQPISDSAHTPNLNSGMYFVRPTLPQRGSRVPYLLSTLRILAVITLGGSDNLS